MRHFISFGAGMQSSVLLGKACHGEITPKPEAAIFADTGWEREQTYENVEFWKGYAAEFGIPVIVVENGNIREDALNPEKRSPSLPFFINTQRWISVAEQRKKLELVDKVSDEELAAFDKRVEKGEIKPYLSAKNTVMLRRQCTNEYKLMPIRKWLRANTDCNFKNPVAQWIGISLDEVQRMKPAREKYMKFRYPLIEQRLYRHDCEKYLKDNDLPVPVRSSCVGCPFHSKREWRNLNDAEFTDVVEFEKGVTEIGMTHPDKRGSYYSNRVFLHRSLVPISERPFDEPATGQQELFDTKDSACDEGGCFL